MEQDVDHLSLTQKAPSSSTKQSTSKSYKKKVNAFFPSINIPQYTNANCSYYNLPTKRPRPSPGTGAAKKLFKDNPGNDAGGRYYEF